MPRPLYVIASLVPFTLLAAGILVAFTAALLAPECRDDIPGTLVPTVWAPLVVSIYAASQIAVRNLLGSGVDWVRDTFSSLPPAVVGGAPRCRRCGAPLTVEPNDVMVRCAYCDTESLVGVRPERVSAFTGASAKAEASASRATELLLRQRSAGRFQVVGRTLTVASLLVLPTIWSLLPSWWSSPWSLAIALDMLVLGVCLWWFAREAFLPPVRIDEVFEMTESFLGRNVDPRRIGEGETPATVRRWDDYGSDRENFLVPALLAFVFAALQAVLIWGG